MINEIEMQQLISTYKTGKWNERLKALKALRQFKEYKEVQDLVFNEAIIDPAIETRQTAVGFANDIANILKMKTPSGKPKVFKAAKFESLDRKIIDQNINSKIASVILDYKIAAIKANVAQDPVFDDFESFIKRFEAHYPREFDLLSGRMLQKGQMRKLFEPKIKFYSSIIDMTMHKYKEIEAMGQ